jgi:hypothetical protein
MTTRTGRRQTQATGRPGGLQGAAARWARLGVAAGLGLALALVAPGPARAATGSGAGEAKARAQAKAAPPARKKSPYKPESLTRSARNYYGVTLGVADMKVHRTNAGNLIRFTYRVTDPAKVKSLGDRQAKPVLVGHTSHAILQVPVMDKVGPLRQAPKLEAGKEYWMVFSNKGDVVKTGERVSVVVGNFRVDGLRVE